MFIGIYKGCEFKGKIWKNWTVGEICNRHLTVILNFLLKDLKLELPLNLNVAAYFPLLAILTLKVATPFELVLTLYVFLFTFRETFTFLMALFLLVLSFFYLDRC